MLTGPSIPARLLAVLAALLWTVPQAEAGKPQYHLTTSAICDGVEGTCGYVEPSGGIFSKNNFIEVNAVAEWGWVLQKTWLQSWTAHVLTIAFKKHGLVTHRFRTATAETLTLRPKGVDVRIWNVHCEQHAAARHDDVLLADLGFGDLGAKSTEGGFRERLHLGHKLRRTFEGAALEALAAVCVGTIRGDAYSCAHVYPWCCGACIAYWS